MKAPRKIICLLFIGLYLALYTSTTQAGSPHDNGNRISLEIVNIADTETRQSEDFYFEPTENTPLNYPWSLPTLVSIDELGLTSPQFIAAELQVRGKPVTILDITLTVNEQLMPEISQHAYISPLATHNGFGIAVSSLFTPPQPPFDAIDIIESLGLMFGPNTLSLSVETDAGTVTDSVEIEIEPDSDEKKKFKAGCLKRVARYFLPQASGKGSITVKNTGECPIQIRSVVSNPIMRGNRIIGFNPKKTTLCTIPADPFAPDAAKPQQTCPVVQNNLLMLQIYCPQENKKQFECCAGEYGLSWQ